MQYFRSWSGKGRDGAASFVIEIIVSVAAVLIALMFLVVGLVVCAGILGMQLVPVNRAIEKRAKTLSFLQSGIRKRLELGNTTACE